MTHEDDDNLWASTYRARRTDPPTSHAAANAVNAGDPSKGEFEVIRAMTELGDNVTCGEVCEHMRRQESHISPRFKKLVLKGLIIDTGITRKSQTTGRERIVWALTDDGRRSHEEDGTKDHAM